MTLIDLDAADTNTVVEVPGILTEKSSLRGLVMPQFVDFFRRLWK